ncbi:MAG: LysR family transcriptional regulator [Gammaproteobacteria bacterium]|nr:LysR family transcriptional regulator [Gammaproteobacteria bacterium]
MPSLQSLQALDAAARHGSYTAAAGELGLTHGAISHRIRELEHRLQMRLFERKGRIMQPTREAMSVLAVARQALMTLQSVFPADADPQRARLVVGVHPALASRWLVPRLPRFESRFPEVGIEIRSTAELGDFLAPGVDVAIRYGGGRWPDVQAELLADEALFPVCTARYAERMALETPADLARCRLLRHAWQPWLPWLQAAGTSLPEPDRGLLVSDASMLIAAATAGAGVALSKRRYAQDAIAEGQLVRLFDIAVTDTNSYYAIWRSGTRPDALAASFIDWLREEFADPAGPAST